MPHAQGVGFVLPVGLRARRTPLQRRREISALAGFLPRRALRAGGPKSAARRSIRQAGDNWVRFVRFGDGGEAPPYLHARTWLVTGAPYACAHHSASRQAPTGLRHRSASSYSEVLRDW